MSKLVVLVLIVTILVAAIAISFVVLNQQQPKVCYSDREISLQKARFDFLNAYNDYPYDTLKVDFLYGLQYARCE